jgi:hypothetical protein
MSANDPVQSHRKVAVGSDRNFGLVFAAFFVLVAALPALHGGPIRWWALAPAAAFAAVAWLWPALLRPLNRVWFAFGMLLHHVVNPLIMAAMFYGAITPVAVLMRRLDKDVLRLKRDDAAETYWVPREQPAPAPKSMSKQF